MKEAVAPSGNPCLARISVTPLWITASPKAALK